KEGALDVYPMPVSQLLTLGEPKYPDDRADYAAKGIGPEHVPDLIRMALDRDLNEADVDSPEVWAPIHAWRALGHLRASEAGGPVLLRLDRRGAEYDEWISEEVPEVLGKIGPVALPALEDYLGKPEGEDSAPGWAAAEAVGHIAREFPAARADCIGILTRRL